MPFPNSDARRRAVKVHDLHKVLTGYQTDIFGEVEISWVGAWGSLATFPLALVSAFGAALVGLWRRRGREA